jgi:hypothetical protein
LFSTRENRGIGIVLSRHFNHVGLIEIRNVNRDWECSRSRDGRRSAH